MLPVNVFLCYIDDLLALYPTYCRLTKVTLKAGYTKQHNNSHQEDQELQDGIKVEAYLTNTVTIVSILRLYLNVLIFILTGLKFMSYNYIEF